MSNRKEEVKAKAVLPDEKELKEIMETKMKKAIEKVDAMGGIDSIKNEMKKKQLTEEELKILDEQEEIEQTAITDVREFIHIQNEYRSNALNLMGLKCQIEFMKQQLDSTNISMQWSGARMSPQMLAIKHDSTIHNYKMLLTHFNLTRDRLVNAGMTDEQIKEVEINGKLYKELPTKKGKELVKDVKVKQKN